MRKIILSSLLAMFSVISQAETTNIINLSNIKFAYDNEMRLQDRGGLSPLFYDHNDIQAKYLINSYFDIFTDYRLIFQNKSTGTVDTGFKDTSMFIEGFNIKYPEQKWGKINLRTRLEISLNDTSPNTYYLNIFPKYNLPYKFTRFEFQPFVADESFWDTDHNMLFVKNRIYAGVDFKITSRILAGTWYYYETKNGSSSHANVAVASIKFLF